MGNIVIDRDTFSHALSNLNFNEIVGILESHKIMVDRKQKKSELITELLRKLDENEINEELYFHIKSKAFSINNNFFDGFFYKYDLKNVKLDYEEFTNILKEFKESNNGNIVYSIYNEKYDENTKTIKFTIDRENKKLVYDYGEDRSRFFKQKIEADIELFIEMGLVYIHSKNCTDSTAIKTFLQKVINKLSANELNNKLKLISPQFEEGIAKKWIVENEISNIGISPASIHMLDLLCEFDHKDTPFVGFGMKKIYLKHEIIDTSDDDCTITGLMFDGKNLQKHKQILEEIKKGKKIKGFSLEVEHLYNDEDGMIITSTLPITIIYEGNSYLRISISSETLATRIEILRQAYIDIKELFLNKIKSNIILNKEHILKFINNIENSEEQKKITPVKSSRMVL